MATKVCIIEVDLGVSVDDIISEDVATLTGQAAQELETALETAKAVQRLKEEKASIAKAGEQKLTNAMEAAFQQLVAAGEAGLPVSTVMATIGDAVPNTSAFTLRMKHFLSFKGNPYILERKKVHGTPHYSFASYNQQLPTAE